ncbi:hypothetical protein [Actinomadura sp. 9N407]|uniref:hypothetical protein n=1 Tax=Actinomadura sp. 9N407 TaxID=3375154 RepID=UPI00378A7C9C
MLGCRRLVPGCPDLVPANGPGALDVPPAVPGPLFGDPDDTLFYDLRDETRCLAPE